MYLLFVLYFVFLKFIAQTGSTFAVAAMVLSLAILDFFAGGPSAFISSIFFC